MSISTRASYSEEAAEAGAANKPRTVTTHSNRARSRFLIWNLLFLAETGGYGRIYGRFASRTAKDILFERKKEGGIGHAAQPGSQL